MGIRDGNGDSPESAIRPEAIAVCGSFSGCKFIANGVHVGFDGVVVGWFDDEVGALVIGELAGVSWCEGFEEAELRRRLARVGGDFAGEADACAVGRCGLGAVDGEDVIACAEFGLDEGAEGGGECRDGWWSGVGGWHGGE